MKRICIDTNVWSALLAGDKRVSKVLAECEAVLVSSVVTGELFDGFSGGSRNRENREIFERFCAKPRSIRIPVTETTAEWYAHIKQALRKKGRPIPVNDIWIAANCMEHGACLVSFDAHFTAVDGLMVYNPDSD